jgi:hypothetical protein|tara:strand:- start:101 stop:571 length:471 start_codon:yes stop_codon:yes gene_type:complete
MLDKNKQLKFPDGSKTPVVITSMGMEENDFGSEYVVRIKESIEGYDHFKPSDGLKRKIAELNISTGDAIIIEKVAPSDKYQYGYFDVEMANNPANKIEMDKYATGEIKAVDPAVHDHPMGAGFAQKDDKMSLHELTLRIETLEKQVAEILKDKLPF